MSSAATGDYLYVQFFTLSSVQAYLTIKRAIDEKSTDVTCNVFSGDVLLFRHPNKMYLTFKSQGVSSKFFVNASYSKTLTSTKFVNTLRCSDKGESLGDVVKEPKTETEVVEPTNIPTVEVLTTAERENLIANNQE